MNTNEHTIARVELRNICKGGRAVGNGWMVGQYNQSGTRMATLKDFGTDEAGARRYAELWNGPETCCICGRSARDPYRRFVAGDIVEGCVDACHGEHLVAGTQSHAWHVRPEAKKIRAML